jgi:hypothetical protein
MLRSGESSLSDAWMLASEDEDENVMALVFTIVVVETVDEDDTDAKNREEEDEEDGCFCRDLAKATIRTCFDAMSKTV